MKLTRISKAGLILTGFRVLIFLGFAIWLKSIRTTVVDIPMPMAAEAVSKDFTSIMMRSTRWGFSSTGAFHSLPPIVSWEDESRNLMQTSTVQLPRLSQVLLGIESQR